MGGLKSEGDFIFFDRPHQKPEVSGSVKSLSAAFANCQIQFIFTHSFSIL